MKFIVDAQLPKSLSIFLNSNGHHSIHTLDLPDRNKTNDKQVIKIALDENRVVITKDTDFINSFLLSGRPSKLVLVKTGNITNMELLNIFNQHIIRITKLLEENSLIEVNLTEIVVHI